MVINEHNIECISTGHPLSNPFMLYIINMLGNEDRKNVMMAEHSVNKQTNKKTLFPIDLIVS